MARSAGAGLALCIAALCADGALAQSQRLALGGRLSDMLFDPSHSRKPAAPPVARYAADSSIAFVLDRSSSQPLIRFEGSDEIWVLYPHDAPKGDVIYKNEMGDPVLRVTRAGGLTVFTATRPEGAAVQFIGGGRALQLPSLLSAFALGKRLAAASGRASQAVRRQVKIEAPDIGQENAALAGDAAVVAAEAFEKLSRGQRNLAALGRIGQIVLLEGERASVQVSRGSLIITIVPGRGLAGRPSSAKIVKALRG